jgi:hypothetical protein
MNGNISKSGFSIATSPIKRSRLTQLATLIAALGFVAPVTSVTLANDLANPNLDNTSVSVQNGPTPVGWSVDAYKSFSGQHFDGCSSEPWCNVQESGGFGLFFKPFQGTVGDEISVRFYQDNPATPNTKFTLSGYAAGEPNYSGFFNTNSPVPQTLFFIEFLDAGGTSLATNTYDLIAAGLPSGGPGSMALFTTPQVTAPANTAVVRAGAWIRNAYSTTGGQSFSRLKPLQAHRLSTINRHQRLSRLEEASASPSESPTRQGFPTNGSSIIPIWQTAAAFRARPVRRSPSRGHQPVMSDTTGRWFRIVLVPFTARRPYSHFLV